jgi:hypothetical protein
MVVDSRQHSNHFTVSSRYIFCDVTDEEIEIRLKSMPDLISEGTVQQALQLLPYIPNILIKLGQRGVLSVRLVPKDSAVDMKHAIRLGGVHADVTIRHHAGLKHQGTVSVTGAGYYCF